MRKILTIVAVIALAASAVFSVPRALGAVDTIKKIQVTVSDTKKLSRKTKKANEELTEYKEKYKDVSMLSNQDIARSIVSLNSASLVSITSIAEIDGEDVVCSEINNVEDAAFFNSQTKQMIVKLKVSNLQEFISDLASSAISVDKITVNKTDGIVEVTVPTMFDSIMVQDKPVKEGE